MRVYAGNAGVACAYLHAVGRVFALRAPHQKALLSERNSRSVTVIGLPFGWRVTIRRIITPKDKDNKQ